jgi:hypothetical protein
LVGHRTLDFGRIFVLPQTLVNDLTKQVVVRPRQIFDFDHKLGAEPSARAMPGRPSWPNWSSIGPEE